MYILLVIGAKHLLVSYRIDMFNTILLDEVTSQTILRLKMPTKAIVRERRKGGKEEGECPLSKHNIVNHIHSVCQKVSNHISHTVCTGLASKIRVLASNEIRNTTY